MIPSLAKGGERSNQGGLKKKKKKKKNGGHTKGTISQKTGSIHRKTRQEVPFPGDGKKKNRTE